MQRNEKLIEERIPKLLLQQSLPAAVGMLVMTLYNVVDSIFIGRGVGTAGLAGVSLSFPLLMFIGAVAQAFGVGFSSVISRSMGEKAYDKAKWAFGNYLVLSMSASFLLLVIGSIFLGDIIKLLGASENLFAYAYDYAQIIIWGAMFFVFLQGSNAILRSLGRAKKAMISMIIASVSNIILDWIFIFYLEMGIAGAAWATFLSWLIGAIYVGNSLFGSKGHFRISFRDLAIKFWLIREVFWLGASSFVRQFSSSLMMVVLNLSLVYYANDLALAAFGIMMRIMMMTLMPIMGIVQGMMPIIGTNYGAREITRTREALKLSIKSATIFATLAFLIIMLFAPQLFSIFTSDTELITKYQNVLRIIVIGLPLIGSQSVIGGFYQALGRAKPAFIISMLRQIFLFIPLMIVLPLFIGVLGVYIAFPIADTLATIIAFVVLRHTLKKLV